MFITTLSSRTRGHLHRISQGHPLHVRLGPRWSSTPLSILILVLDQLRQGITWTPGKSHRQIHHETASQERVAGLRDGVVPQPVFGFPLQQKAPSLSHPSARGPCRLCPAKERQQRGTRHRAACETRPEAALATELRTDTHLKPYVFIPNSKTGRRYM